MEFSNDVLVHGQKFGNIYEQRRFSRVFKGEIMVMFAPVPCHCILTVPSIKS